MSDRERQQSADELNRLEHRMREEEELENARGRSKLVFGSGNPNAKLVLIGEAPGAQEDRAGRPFVGPAGKLLDEALQEAGLDRDSVWITNAVKFRPTAEGAGGRLKNRPPTKDEVRLFHPWLERELAIINPQALLCLGATAAVAVLGRPVRVTAERGQWVDGPRGIPTMPTYHPAFMVRRMPGWEDKFAEFVEDIRAAATRW